MYRDLYYIIAQYLGPINTLKYLDLVCKESHNIITCEEKSLIRHICNVQSKYRFTEACRIGTTSYIIHFAKYGITNNGVTECLRLKKLEAIEWLISNGYIVEIQSLLEQACCYECDELVFKFWNSCLSPNRLVYNSVQYGRTNLVEFLWPYVDNNALRYLNRTCILEKAVESGSYHLVKYLLDHGITMKHNAQYNLIIKAADADSLDLVKYFYAMGTDGSIGLESAFCIACYKNNVPIAQFLLDRGAHISYHNRYMPIYNAILGQSVDVMRLLESRGADLDYYITRYGMPNVKLTPEFKQYMIDTGAYKKYRDSMKFCICCNITWVILSMVCLVVIIVPCVIYA